MISVTRIQKLAEAEKFEQLLREVLLNGREPALPLRVQLSADGGLKTAALGMALQRVIELQRGMSTIAARLAAMLRSELSRSTDNSMALAAGIRGLLMFNEILPGSGAEERGENDDLSNALDILAARQGDSGLFDDDETVSGFVIWQLGRKPEFLRRIRFGDLYEALSSRGVLQQGSEIGGISRIARATLQAAAA